ncbi:uncharacterized protein [Heliangelus exortis]|uniref:uncharacterized protein isoform X7 n=1 Tax=Heliangelus exortis TaxID=472823 RepID=UPI003A902441
MQESSNPDGPFQEGSRSYQGERATYDTYKISPYMKQETSKPDRPFQEGSRSYQGERATYDTYEISPYMKQETSKPDRPFQEGSGCYQGERATYDTYKISPYMMQETRKSDRPFQEGSGCYQGQMDSKGRGLSGSVNSQPQVPGSLHRQHATSEPYKMQETSNPDGPFQEGSRSYQGERATYDTYKISPYMMQETSKSDRPFQEGSGCYQGERATYDTYKISSYMMQETSKPDRPFQEGSGCYQGQMDSKGRGLSGSVNSQPQIPGSLHRQHATSEPYKMQESSNPDGPFQEGSRSYQGALPVGVTQAELQEKQEAKALKTRQKRNTLLSSKMMSMHQHSENMNDPLRLSAVLHMYEMLRLQGWAKLKFSQDPSMSYKDASILIKELFSACEKDVEQRTNSIFELLDNPSLNDAENKRKQESIQKIRSLLRDFSYQNNSELYSKIVMQAGIDTKSASLKEFTHQCCQVYIFLLLQEPPVKAVWHEQGISKTYSEHVIKKDCSEWRKAEFLWPVMKRGEEVIVKGVVWD